MREEYGLNFLNECLPGTLYPIRNLADSLLSWTWSMKAVGINDFTVACGMAREDLEDEAVAKKIIDYVYKNKVRLISRENMEMINKLDQTEYRQSTFYKAFGDIRISDEERAIYEREQEIKRLEMQKQEFEWPKVASRKIEKLFYLNPNSCDLSRDDISNHYRVQFNFKPSKEMAQNFAITLKNLGIDLHTPLDQIIKKLDEALSLRQATEMEGFGAKLSSGSVRLWSHGNHQSKLDEVKLQPVVFHHFMKR